LQMAVAERGLLVLDVYATGKAGHAAREEGDNAIYHALKDIAWFRDYQFEKVSSLLGPNKMSVTVMETSNKAHNQVPSECHFVVDTRILQFRRSAYGNSPAHELSGRTAQHEASAHLNFLRPPIGQCWSITWSIALWISHDFG
jgi:acetylornithine deacetylase/succinyl-diaminopimelate desuccinylase-like protein